MFRIEIMSKEEIDNFSRYKDEYSFLKLVQVGIFRDNGMGITEVAELLKRLIKFIFKDNVLIVLEMNFKGEIILNKVLEDPNIEEYVFLNTYHSEHSKIRRPGIRLNSSNRGLYISDFAEALKNNKIQITERASVVEITAFGVDGKGKFTSQTGHDDIFMSCVNLNSLFTTEDWYYFTESILDEMSTETKNIIYAKMDLDMEEKADTNDVMSMMKKYNEELYSKPTPIRTYGGFNQKKQTTNFMGF